MGCLILKVRNLKYGAVEVAEYALKANTFGMVVVLISTASLKSVAELRAVVFMTVVILVVLDGLVAMTTTERFAMPNLFLKNVSLDSNAAECGMAAFLVGAIQFELSVELSSREGLMS